MKTTPILSAVVLLLTASLRAEETLTVGGAVIPLAKGWTQTVQPNGAVDLSPPNLPQGIVCNFTLLGGDPSDGSLRALKDRFATEWKDFEALGKFIKDDGGKLTGVGTTTVTDSRYAQIETPKGVTIHVWLLLISANQRIERMVLVSTSLDAFNQNYPAVSTMVNGIRWLAPQPVQATALAAHTPNAFGHLLYTAPPGWAVKRSDRNVAFSPTDIPQGESLEILVMPAVNATGTLPAALAAAWDEAAIQLHFTKTNTVNHIPYNAQEQRTSFKGWPYIRADGVLSATSDIHDEFINLTVMKINNRFERILVRSRQRDVNYTLYSSYQSPAYYAAIQNFIFSLQFDDWKDPKLQPATLKPDGIVGAWSGISMIGGGLHTAYAIFFSNGQVFFASRFPLRGCNDLDTFVDSELFPRYWGTYDFKNGRGSLKMIFGDIPVVAKGNDLVFTTNKTDHTFIRLPSVDGAHFSGTYAFPQPSGTYPSITFTPNGRFDDHGALHVLRFESNFPFSPTTNPGGGTYAIKEYTLLLNYSDGRTYRLAFPSDGFDPHNPSPPTLTLGYQDQTLKKQ